MNKNNNVAIGILAYNEELYIEKVILELSKLGLPLYILDDSSTDNTRTILQNLSKKIDITVVINKKNQGAGTSTIKLIQKIKKDGFQYLLKVDGDDQFKYKDVENIVEIAQSGVYDFIKSNRFWDGGIEGKIPNKRYLGNLFATILLQFVAGTNKLFDPLNGLFAVDVKILDKINTRVYPKRYGYPFYFSALSAISFFKIYQVNNIVSYGKQKSNLSSIRVFFTLMRLTLHFCFLKIKNKILIGKYQRSAFLDITLLFFLALNIITLFRFVLIFSSVAYFDTSYTGSWALILLLLFIFTIFIFIESFKEEKAIRNKFIEIDD